MRFGKRILSLAMALSLSAAPVHAIASEAPNQSSYTKAMLSLTPYNDNAQYLSNLADAEQLFVQLGNYDESASMVSYARGMKSLFSGKFAEAEIHFSEIIGNSAIDAELIEWELPASRELLTYAQAANIEVTGGYLYKAAELYSQIPNLFDAQIRMDGVIQRMKEIGHPDNITVTPDAHEMKFGDTIKLSMEFSPMNAYIGDLQWFSSDESIAVVDAHGNVTATGSGIVAIGYGQGVGSNPNGTCSITIEAVNATSMILPQSQVTLCVGESIELPLDVQPLGAQVNWNTNDPSVVTVKDGVLYAAGEGFTNIVATSGSLTCVCSVTVVPPYKSINAYPGDYIVDRSSAYVNKTTSRSVEARCAVDGSTTSAWNTNGRWNGEWISLAVRDGQKYKVSYLVIYNGYQRQNSTYYNNARIKTLDVYCDGNYVTTLNLSDSWGAQTHTLPEPMIGSEFKFVITGVYYGSDFSDCALSELELHD